MKQTIRKLLPIGILQRYHQSLAIISKVVYGMPSEKMIVVGVTGTNGKSTTVILIAKILEEAGHKVGATSTAIFKIGQKEWLNDKKMTMLGRFALQRLLRDMTTAGCQYAVIETSSEGIKQYRHLGVHYDIGVFTNLTPEHIESHGSFANYKEAKLKLFRKIAKDPPKKIMNWIPDQVRDDNGVKKVFVVNGDDEHTDDFLNYKVNEKIIFKIQDTRKQETRSNCFTSLANRGGQANKFQAIISNLQNLVAQNIQLNSNGVSFKVDGTDFNLKLFGQFNIYNALAAIAVAKSQGIDLEVCKLALEKVDSVPGRMEFIETQKDFKVLVDYAPEPESIAQLYQTIKGHNISPGKIIHVLGSCGGGRDKSRRPILGKLAAGNADIVIVTDEDPYDEDPMEIISQVAKGAQDAGKKPEENLFIILDRRKAIQKALSLAQAEDLVLLTGKGCEQAICVANGHKIPWDERKVAQEELDKL
ncbi:MAG TPA: UDP-N-acetylmuramoyl-L-alanyl-D-glutamate--2,6-diaminopimelate ligase [Patescibacteria group bacterium]|nr:UDP-N-acetylmuramoyl-L-alanyl-D-glutamate--2,6-diaminopimelate ligase [Patescibacteria group bacterium]